MAEKINVNIVAETDGTYSATIAEFPDVKVTGAPTLDVLRQGVEVGLTEKLKQDGKDNGPVKLPPFKPGQTTSLSDLTVRSPASRRGAGRSGARSPRPATARRALSSQPAACA